ncbi:MAG TPA: DHCW motif cupin fold protein [Candidatus Aminicenantes bacterium]|nr:DHCW motif cupin fold protein [Candidatus Aminicenantes bacterium]HRY66006.1 DHCW motif cupin fold protein [Candidatus Aminicenantes bacterium]HRZ72945.1 DHCW motif cupin fold protein [Candidatus Aminicenantes bacterium]
MSEKPIPYRAIDWNAVPRTEHKGETGTSFWRTVQIGGLRIRIVEYSPGYLADHWCRKGHIVHCLDGEFVNEQENGDRTVMTGGMTYVVSDGASSHRSRTEGGATLLIVDGDFLKPE